MQLRDAARAILERRGFLPQPARSGAAGGVSHAPHTVTSQVTRRSLSNWHGRVRGASPRACRRQLPPGLRTTARRHRRRLYAASVARRPAGRLMFGPQLPNRDAFPELAAAADASERRWDTALNDPALGLAVWRRSRPRHADSGKTSVDLGSDARDFTCSFTRRVLCAACLSARNAERDDRDGYYARSAAIWNSLIRVCVSRRSRSTEPWYGQSWADDVSLG